MFVCKYQIIFIILSFFHFLIINRVKQMLLFNIFVDKRKVVRYNLCVKPIDARSEVSMADEKVEYHIDNNFIVKPQKYGSVMLYQIGRLHAMRTTVVETHVQKVFELTIVKGGEGIVSTNGIPVRVSRGDIYLSFPCETHKIESDFKSPLKYDFFAFDTVQDEQKCELERIMLEYSGADKRVFRDERVDFLVGNAISELGQNGFGSGRLLEGMLEQIIIYTVRGFRPVPSEGFSERVTAPEALCYRLMNYIDTHIYSMKKLEELAEVTGYSYGYLSTLYKKTTTGTLADYYRNKKLEIAKMLVLENKLKIYEIAEILNYASVYAFSKAFKNHFNVSPEGYRKSGA